MGQLRPNASPQIGAIPFEPARRRKKNREKTDKEKGGHHFADYRDKLRLVVAALLAGNQLNGAPSTAPSAFCLGPPTRRRSVVSTLHVGLKLGPLKSSAHKAQVIWAKIWINFYCFFAPSEPAAKQTGQLGRASLWHV